MQKAILAKYINSKNKTYQLFNNFLFAFTYLNIPLFPLNNFFLLLRNKQLKL